MATLTTEEKIAALNTLYYRVGQVAGAMGGAASPVNEPITYLSVSQVIPRTEVTHALRVEMPGYFVVIFSPTFPLKEPGNAISVRAKRTHNGGRKSDWTFILAPNGWQRTQQPLTDDELRECLTPQGLPPLC